MHMFSDRLTAVRAEIAAACRRAGRDPASVTLVAVSKTHPAASIIEAAGAGLTHFGENRVEEASKIAQVSLVYPNLTWHMIGHVQSRKAREVSTYYDWVHSVDSLRIAERYSRFAVELNRSLDILLEVNISGEDSKEGFMASRWKEDAGQRNDFFAVARGIAAFPNLRLRGLMTMATIVEHMEHTRPVFTSLRQLRDALATEIPTGQWDCLSMGMSDDYPVAIEEGATHVRIGRALFGLREVK